MRGDLITSIALLCAIATAGCSNAIYRHPVTGVTHDCGAYVLGMRVIWTTKTCQDMYELAGWQRVKGPERGAAVVRP